MIDKKDLSNPTIRLCYKSYQDLEVLCGPSKHEFVCQNLRIEVNCGTVETKPKARSLLGIRVHFAGVLCVSLGTAI